MSLHACLEAHPAASLLASDSPQNNPKPANLGGAVNTFSRNDKIAGWPNNQFAAVAIHLICNHILEIAGEALVQPNVIPVIARHLIAEKHMNELGMAFCCQISESFVGWIDFGSSCRTNSTTTSPRE